MNHLSQKDPRWNKDKLGFGTTTIGSHGCKLTCLAMLSYRLPNEINEALKAGGAFQVDLLIDQKAADVLGLKYSGKVTQRPDVPCMMEVNPNIPNYPQHFVIHLPLGGVDWIIDPLDGKKKKKPVAWGIKSYRLFEEKRPTFESKLKEYLAKVELDLIKLHETY